MAKILLIDDDEAIRFTLQQVLKSRGHSVEVAEDGRKAASIIREHNIDLLITDMCMPEKEGFETIMEIRQNWPNLPVIAMSGGLTGMPESKERLLKIATTFGANAVLMKPFSPELLYRTLDQVLASKPAP